MKNTYNGWSTMDTFDIDATADLILTGRKASECNPELWLFKYIGEPSKKINILDFGCGFGRNTFGMGIHSSEWTIIGYDNDSMLNKTNQFYTIHYTGKFPNNVWFTSNWEYVKNYHFDVIFCSLVLQHIHEIPLIQYITDFKSIANKIVVLGRRINDDLKQRSTWTILEEQGLIPIEFHDTSGLIQYNKDGDPYDHNVAIYNL